MKCLLLLETFLLFMATAESLKILGLFNHPGLSHFYIFRPLLRALRDKGHEITVMSYFPEDVKLSGYTDITFNYVNEGLYVFDMVQFSGTKMEKYMGPMILNQLANLTCEVALSSEGYQRFLKSKEKFDLIISEFFNSNCLLLPAVSKLKVPFIGVTSHVLMSWSNDWVGNPDNPSYISSLFLGEFHSFFDKVEHFIVYVYHKVYYHCVMKNQDLYFLKKYGAQYASLSREAIYNTSLILVNTHPSIHGARPMVPGVVEVGGIHVGDIKKLPKHIEKWINESTHGVIYFSMGSMIKGHTFPEEKRQMFLRAFARLPQRVLWKWETETMPGKPDNVLLLKWMPQFDILCHPNVKVFIAHGGLLGVTESVHCGVPMLLMPQFGDQFTNAKAIEANGGGLMLDFRYITEEQIFETLTSLLSDNFNKKAKELSARFKDRPMPPLETAIYWVEYVARHGGAPHLRTAAVGMPLYQYLLLDVIAFLLTIFIVFTYVWYKILKFIYRKIFSAKQKVKTN